MPDGELVPLLGPLPEPVLLVVDVKDVPARDSRLRRFAAGLLRDGDEVR